jgi:two-component system, chemotaxis family, protein-glutamate methylesterase/glutaminase
LPPIRILVVDDSAVIRMMLSDVLSADRELSVAAAVGNGKLALAKIPELKPDLVTLDVEMPGMNGIETLVAIRKLYPRLPVIMFSSVTGPGLAATVEALARGATDYVAKPANVGGADGAAEHVRQELIPRIKAFCLATLSAAVSTPAAPPALVPLAPARSATRIEIVAIGSSTGGPNALAEIMPQFPRDFPVPVVIVQHMPRAFTSLFSDRLNAISNLHVLECKGGEKLSRGQVWIAPGDYHMTVSRVGGDFVLGLNQDPPENSCRPAVDVLFRSVAQAYGPNSLAVVLTGMGVDGMRGAKAIRQAGGAVLAQDQATSVVWGMPGSVVNACLEDRVCALGDIPAEIMRRASLWRVATGVQG